MFNPHHRREKNPLSSIFDLRLRRRKEPYLLSSIPKDRCEDRTEDEIFVWRWRVLRRWWGSSKKLSPIFDLRSQKIYEPPSYFTNVFFFAMSLNAFCNFYFCTREAIALDGALHHLTNKSFRWILFAGIVLIPRNGPRKRPIIT